MEGEEGEDGEEGEVGGGESEEGVKAGRAGGSAAEDAIADERRENQQDAGWNDHQAAGESHGGRPVDKGFAGPEDSPEGEGDTHGNQGREKGGQREVPVEGVQVAGGASNPNGPADGGGEVDDCAGAGKERETTPVSLAEAAGGFSDKGNLGGQPNGHRGEKDEEDGMRKGHRRAGSQEWREDFRRRRTRRGGGEE